MLNWAPPWLTKLVLRPPSANLVRDQNLFASLTREVDAGYRDREYSFSGVWCTPDEFLNRDAERAAFWDGYEAAMLNSLLYHGEESILPAFTVRAGEFKWGGKAGTGYALNSGVVSFT